MVIPGAGQPKEGYYDMFGGLSFSITTVYHPWINCLSMGTILSYGLILFISGEKLHKSHHVYLSMVTPSYLWVEYRFSGSGILMLLLLFQYYLHYFHHPLTTSPAAINQVITLTSSPSNCSVRSHRWSHSHPVTHKGRKSEPSVPYMQFERVV